MIRKELNAEVPRGVAKYRSMIMRRRYVTGSSMEQCRVERHAGKMASEDLSWRLK